MATEQLSNNASTTGASTTGGLAVPVADRKNLGVCSLLLGLGFIYFVGFAPMMAVHNAAHDTRHTAAFPCH